MIKLKRLFAAFSAALVMFSLTSCGGHASHYKAVGCVSTNTADSASLSFFEFEGTMVFKLKLKDQSESDIKYTAELKEGKATVFYEYGGSSSELFKISSGEKTDSRGGYVEKGTVYVTIKTDGKCKNGSFKFSIQQ